MKSMSNPPPLGLAGTVTVFVVPTMLCLIVVFLAVPQSLRMGVPANLAFAGWMTLYMAMLLVFAWRLMRLEGVEPTVAAMRTRLRIGQPGFRNLWTGVAVGLVGYACLLVLIPSIEFMTRYPLLEPHAWLGSVTVATLLYVMFISAFCEEIWWRGYVLPRQIRALGRPAWLVHGTLWTLYGISLNYYELLAILPAALLTTWIAQREESTWPSLIAHITLVGISFLHSSFLPPG